MTESQKLVAEYVDSGSETAFRELVSRYINLVYSTALRLVNGDTHLAEDVVQMVFVDLARMAQTLPHEVMLGGWLHRHTCFLAANTLRGERRRQFRERQAVEMNTLQEHTDFNFSSVAPMVDQAINELGDLDRKAILLRFFEQRDFSAIGEAIGGSEDSARMRVNRALEKLAARLKRRGVTSTGTALSMALSANAVQVAPAGMAASVSTIALTAGTVAPAATAVATVKAAAMTTMQKVLVISFLAVGAGTAVYEAHQVADARAEIQTLNQRQGPLTWQIQQWEREREDATKQMAAALAENKRLQSEPTEEEVLQLRNQVTLLLALEAPKTHDSTAVAAKSWLDAVNRLKEYVKEHPEKTIPEFQFLAMQRWLNAVESSGPPWLNSIKDAGSASETATNLDQYYSGAISFLEAMAENDFGARIQGVLRKYADANQGQFPTDLSQLQPYWGTEEEALLEQLYEIKPASILPAAQIKELSNQTDWVVMRKEPIPNFSSRIAYFASGCVSWDTLPAAVRRMIHR